MNSAKSRTLEESLETPSMLDAIRSLLRPILLRRWRASRDCAVRDAAASNLSRHERALYMAGFNNGWMAGARDATINHQDLPLQEEDPQTSIH